MADPFLRGQCGGHSNFCGGTSLVPLWVPGGAVEWNEEPCAFSHAYSVTRSRWHWALSGQ